MFQGTKKLRTNNASLSPLSPTTLFSQHLTGNYYQNLSDSITYKPTTLTEAPKMQQLPDLVKESSILKSKTAPNIYDKSSIKDIEQIEDRIFLHRTNKTAMNNIENLENLQNIEHVLSSNMEENNDFRSRSPLHETSIVVPQVDWNKKNEDKDISSEDSEIDSDSLSSDFNEMENDNFMPINILPPRLQIHSTDGDLVLDEGVKQYKCYVPDDDQAFEPDSIEVSFLQDQRLLNRCVLDIDSSKDDMHIVETVNNNLEHLNLLDKSNCSSPISETSITSNKQDDSEENDIITAFTETEFSEWARDGEVLISDDFYDVELDPNFVTVQKKDASFSAKKSMPIYIGKKDETVFDSSRNDRKVNQKFPENNTSSLLTNDEDINYMDTDNELLLDDSLQDISNITMLRNKGYVEFVNIKANISTPVKTQCNLPLTNAPIVKLDLENDLHDENEKEEGFKDANVIEIDPITMEDVIGKLNESIKRFPKIKSDIQMKTDEQCKKVWNKDTEQEQLVQAFNKELLQSMEEDSLLTVEPTDDTTISDAITIVASPISHQMPITSTEMIQKQEEINKTNCINPDYLEYINKLQFRIAEFSNTKDSIDIRKSKRKFLKNITQTHNTEMITENITCQEIMATNNNDNNTSSSVTSKKLEEITKERSKQKDLIQDLLMDKFEAHKQKSIEKKARRAARLLSFSKIPAGKPKSSSAPSIGTKFVPTSIISPINSSICTIFNETKKLSDIVISSRSHEQHNQLQIEQMTKKIDKSMNQDEKSITVSLQNIFESFAPIKSKNEEQEKMVVKHRQDIKNWNKMKSKEDLSLDSENKRMKELEVNTIRSQFSIENTNKNNMSMNEKFKSYSFSMMNNLESKLQISKSTDNIKNFAKRSSFEKLSISTKSMDELYTADMSILDNCLIAKKDRRKPKDLERRKSIIQAVSDFFFKKETNSSLHEKEKISMFRLPSKSKGKVSIIIIINVLSVY